MLFRKVSWAWAILPLSLRHKQMLLEAERRAQPFYRGWRIHVAQPRHDLRPLGVVSRSSSLFSVPLPDFPLRGRYLPRAEKQGCLLFIRVAL